MRFAVSASSPEAVATAATAVIGFTLMVEWNWLGAAGFLSFQVRMQGENLHFLHGGVSGEVTHYHLVLFDAFFIRNDFHVPDCTAETIAKECSLSELSCHRSFMWSGVSLSSWTRCCRRGVNWLWCIPRFSHLPCYSMPCSPWGCFTQQQGCHLRCIHWEEGELPCRWSVWEDWSCQRCAGLQWFNPPSSLPVLCRLVQMTTWFCNPCP